MILDPMSDIFRYDQTKNTSRGLVRISGAGSRVEDVKLVDARTFNFCSFANDSNLTLGTSCAAIFPQGDNDNVRIENADVFRADDGVINNRHNGPLRRNNKWSEMSTGLQKAETGPQESPHLEQQFFFERFSAVDCTLMPHLFQGRNMGRKPKNFSFHDLSIPASTGESSWRAIGRKTGTALRVDNNPEFSGTVPAN